MNKFGRFKQPNFRDWQLRDPQLLEILTNQRQQLRQLARVEKNDEAGFAEACHALDIELLHYACVQLRTALDEAARDDCAGLIAESVLDAANNEDAIERWKKWLGATAWWPQLASDQWRRSLDIAVALLIEQLENKEIEVDATTAEQIENSVKQLELKDLLPPDVYANYFPLSEPVAEEADF